MVAHRFLRSFLLSGLLFALLLWQPVSLMLLRILREQIYPGQLLLVVALVSAMLFLGKTLLQQIGLAVLAGLVLGWFWLTREEGVWNFPALVVLIGAALWRAYKTSTLRRNRHRSGGVDDGLCGGADLL